MEISTNYIRLLPASLDPKKICGLGAILIVGNVHNWPWVTSRWRSLSICLPIFPEETYPFFGHFQTLGDSLFQIVNRFELADFELKLAASGGSHRQRNDWQGRQFRWKMRWSSCRWTMAAQASPSTCTDRRIGIIHDLMRAAVIVAWSRAAVAFSRCTCLAAMTTLRIVVGFVSWLHFIFLLRLSFGDGFPFLLFCFTSFFFSLSLSLSLYLGKTGIAGRPQEHKNGGGIVCGGWLPFPWGREIRAQTQRARTHTHIHSTVSVKKSNRKTQFLWNNRFSKETQRKKE